MEEIIKDWTSELQEQSTKFRKQAEALSLWDRRILSNRNALIRLESEVAKVVETQHSLERQLELIETHQQEVEKALESMEMEATQFYKDERANIVADEPSAVRDMMFEQSEHLERELEQMGEQIRETIENINMSQVGELGLANGSSPVDVVVRILNNQLSSLVWIDDKAEELSSRIHKLLDHGATADKAWMSSRFRGA